MISQGYLFCTQDGISGNFALNAETGNNITTLFQKIGGYLQTQAALDCKLNHDIIPRKVAVQKNICYVKTGYDPHTTVNFVAACN